MPMNKEAEQTAQTPQGVKLQGTLLMCLAVAMVIAGATAIYMQWQGTEKENPPVPVEVQLNEEVEDTQGVQDATVPEPDSTGSGTPAEPTVEPEPEAYIVPPAKETTMLRCVVSTYDDGSLIQTCFPLNKQ